ncbi:guanylate kinase, partial [Acidobacteriia bacterium AH_259_A11_L15]|nr:guanylate kinase [Acidobacteriia bacterium AH_259_A11_L15]
ERLRARGLDTPEMVRRRLEHARQEIAQYEIYDYLVVNRVLEETCEQLRAIVLAERNRRAGLSPESAEAREAERRAAAARKEATQEQVSAILERFEAQTS